MDNINDIPEEKRNLMISYAKELRRKYPKMTTARITRKVAEKFHINIITQVGLKPPAVPINVPESSK